MTTATVLSQIRISVVYCVLTGIQPRRTGRDRWRGPAPWRGGTGFNVAGDDRRGVWHDFVADEGGGVVDLVRRVHGGSRANALRFVADLAGVMIDDCPASHGERRAFAERRKVASIVAEDVETWRRALIPELDARKLAAWRSDDDDALACSASRCSLISHGSPTDIVREFIRHRASNPTEVARLIATGRDHAAESERITAEVVLLLSTVEESGHA